MEFMSATCGPRQAKLILLKAHLGDPSQMLLPTLPNSHSPVPKEAQTFSSPPCPLLGPSMPAGTPAERASRVSPAHTPSPSELRLPSCWEHLHLPRLLQHLQPLRLLKLRLRCQQDVPLPGRGATVHLREGRSEDTEAAPGLCKPSAAPPTPQSYGTDTPPRPGQWRGCPQAPGRSQRSCSVQAEPGLR